jgi:hypothetical protein
MKYPKIRGVSVTIGSVMSEPSKNQILMIIESLIDKNEFHFVV